MGAGPSDPRARKSYEDRLTGSAILVIGGGGGVGGEDGGGGAEGQRYLITLYRD
jgi:hypothetical protein